MPGDRRQCQITKTPIDAAEAKPAEVSSAPVTRPASPAPPALPSLPASPALQWKESIEEAITEASRSRKRILVCFLLPGSTVSDQLLEKVLEAPRVRRELARDYVLVRLNIAEHSGTAARLGVFRGGTVVVYSHDGQALEQIADASDPDQFLARLRSLRVP